MTGRRRRPDRPPRPGRLTLRPPEGWRREHQGPGQAAEPSAAAETRRQGLASIQPPGADVRPCRAGAVRQATFAQHMLADHSVDNLAARCQYIVEPSRFRWKVGQMFLMHFQRSPKVDDMCSQPSGDKS
jgi:hypothetical protein